MNNDENSTNKDAFAAKKKKRMSVERIYQKKTQLEHILLRPDTYIGSVEPIKQNMWVYDAEMGAIVSKEITFVPGLYKIFDEILGKQAFIELFLCYADWSFPKLGLVSVHEAWSDLKKICDILPLL